MIFNPIDIDNWSRKPYFDHYLNNVRCTYSMTVNIDITCLLSVLKNKGIKLYPTLIHMITTVVNHHIEFRTCFDSEGRLGYWDSLSPSFTVFHDDDKTFSSIWTLYAKEFNDFYSRYLDDMKMYGSVNQFAAKANEPPNCFPISSIPWVSFTGFNLNVYNEGTYLLPIFTMGKYFEQNGKILLPLSGQFHHAVCDGYHVGVLFNELQLRAVTCKEWCK
ncbi:chloramphenicol acetyltransferase [Bacillus sp. FJAT-18019]|uniref:Chloramphenicol acetyltransferase n=1 Tax=Paenibacillus solani TaxID=1705565 RepID=A0A0M1N1D7_9BACL|nr:type A chloramphenicol O-acetyltransferase [Paenibacillus solani]KOP65864.1 chloramphenicol acetyltransferase [Bacillus sp. FJAT-18019]KOR75967.1 chloramphenicol acetyltransferase [Paenibacillus solani]